MLVTMKDMLAEAKRARNAVGGFNCATLESARAAVEAAQELNVPMVLMHAEVHEQYIPIELAAPIMLALAKRATVPVCVHLDHGTTLEYAARALRLGFTSVMIDASGRSPGDNIAETRAVARMAHAMGATVEAELGSMPHNFGGELETYAPEDFYTDPDEAGTFVEETGVDALAISFGTVHGVYKVAPKLNLDIVSRVAEATGGLPLVMHGGSGLSDADYRGAIERGICKINYYTYEALAGGRGARQAVVDCPEGLQYHSLAATATDYMRRDVRRAMRVFAGMPGEA